MKTIAFFNNKGGVGKTSLVYHLAWMFGEIGKRVIAADFDPQANLSGMFLSDATMAEMWQTGKRKTVDAAIAPLFEGTGDISSESYIEEVDERIGLLVGDLELSKREDDLSEQWPKCMDGAKRAFRVTTAFARLLASAGNQFEANLALVDVGPNLGAINRVALIASDYVVIPLAPDLFSLQGLRNVGPVLKSWEDNWKERIGKKPEELDIELPGGGMVPLGYIVMRHTTISSRPVRAYLKWIKKIPNDYEQFVNGTSGKNNVSIEDDPNLLAHLKDYRSLMPMVQAANKPMFMLKPADGVIGAQQQAVTNCYRDFKVLAEKIISTIEQKSNDFTTA